MTAPAATAFADLLDAMLADRATLATAGRAATAVRGGPATALPDDEVLRHIQAILQTLRAHAGADPAAVALAERAADDLAADRAEQGISLSVLLDGVGAARAVLLSQFLDRGRQALGPDALVDALAPVDSVLDALQRRMVLAHQAAERQAARSSRAGRVEALRELLGGGPLSWAVEAGLDTAGRYRCLVADVSRPSESLRLEPALETPHGVSALVHGILCRVSPDLPGARDVRALVVHSPPVPVDELAATYTACRAALPVLRSAGARGLVPLLGVAGEVASAGQPQLGLMLSRELLAELRPSDDFHRLLATTALAYLAGNGNLAEASARLHVHASTVKYRLRRFGELVGGDHWRDGALAGRYRWSWALRVWLAAYD